MAVRDNSRLGQLASLVLIEPLAHVRGGCTTGNSRLWQLASLVLIEPLAHVRGVAPLAIRGAWPRGTIRALER